MNSLNEHLLKNEVAKRIAAYKYEQKVLLRLIGRAGGLSQDKFDELFVGREWNKKAKLKIRSAFGDSYILGFGAHGFSMWAKYLDLLQIMIYLDMVDTIRNQQGKIVYIIPEHDDE